MTNMRSNGNRVRSVLTEIDTGNINASGFRYLIRELGLGELRALGRELIARAEQDNGANDAKEYLPIVQKAVRRLLDDGSEIRDHTGSIANCKNAARHGTLAAKAEKKRG